MRNSDMFSTSQLVICDCGTLCTLIKYKSHLKTKLHETRMNKKNNTVVCSCGLTHSNSYSSRVRHLNSIKHKQMLCPFIKKITPSEIPVSIDSRFKKGYSE